MMMMMMMMMMTLMMIVNGDDEDNASHNGDSCRVQSDDDAHSLLCLLHQLCQGTQQS